MIDPATLLSLIPMLFGTYVEVMGYLTWTTLIVGLLVLALAVGFVYRRNHNDH